MARTRDSGVWLWVAAALSLVASLTAWGPLVLYPFKLFTTWVHECGHALATVLVGGRVQAITIAPDTSGLTLGLIPAGPLARGLVASAGYLGAALVGCVLMAAARVPRWAHAILLALGGFLLLTAVLWMRNLFGFVVVLAWGAALVALGRRGAGDAARFVLGLLAVQVALNAVFDIRVLFLVRGGPSDAETMARLFLLPASLWATAWMVLSVAMLGATLWLTRERR
jgi:Peptidase M50B-like